MEHITFLFFPYIIEYLSFIYYIIFIPNNFIIQSLKYNITILIIILIINSILIIIYNLENYINIICSNKIFTTTIFEAYSNLKENNIKKYRPISYKYSHIPFYILILLQNFVLFLNVEKFIYNKKLFKIIISIVLILIILIYFIKNSNEFNYSNLINTSINVIILFCFYTIIINFIIFISGYNLTKEFNEMIYILFKLFLSYITYSLIIIKRNYFFQTQISKILFQEKLNKSENYYINSFYYLHEIMLKIKGNNEIELTLILINILNNHMQKCNKSIH